MPTREPRKNIKLDPKVMELMRKWMAEFVKHENSDIEVSWNPFFQIMCRRRQKYV